jgi:hypothetical protein
MIVNDLDAGATKTKVEFRRDLIRVTGNGEPVTDDGWERLAVLQGAGRRVAHKVGGIGIKNHGLKTGFLIGDQITISSGGRYSRQVINKNENESRPEPGAMIEPLKSFRRIQGCEVSIPYRKRGFSTGLGSGEGFSSKQIRYSDIREMYHEATSKLPLALMGIVRHGERPEYSVEISHFQLPTERISWKCGPAKSLNGRNSYVRTVTARRDGKVRFQHRERVWQTKVSATRFVGRKIPVFFRDKRSVILELSWAIDKDGHPIPGPDQFRYPVSFPSENTGLGISISAPWRGDTQRHTLQSDDELNDDILDLAIDELALATKLLSIPLSRARSLDFLGGDAEQIDEDRADQYTRALISIGGVPAVRRLELKSKGPRDGKVVGVAPSEDNPLIVPRPRWESGEPPKSLVRLMPVGQIYLCPDVPEIVYDSVKIVMDSYGSSAKFITFDENDVMQRSTGTSEWFRLRQGFEYDLSSPDHTARAVVLIRCRIHI